MEFAFLFAQNWRALCLQWGEHSWHEVCSADSSVEQRRLSLSPGYSNANCAEYLNLENGCVQMLHTPEWKQKARGGQHRGQRWGSMGRAVPAAGAKDVAGGRSCDRLLSPPRCRFGRGLTESCSPGDSFAALLAAGTAPTECGWDCAHIWCGTQLAPRHPAGHLRFCSDARARDLAACWQV